jgi:hypothetical protein
VLAERDVVTELTLYVQVGVLAEKREAGDAPAGQLDGVELVQLEDVRETDGLQDELEARVLKLA